MSKVKYNGNNIINIIKPAIINSIGHLNSAIEVASGVSFPNDEFNFGNVKADLNDCLSSSKKYQNWISTINTNFDTIFNNEEIAIQEIKVNSVKQRNSIVK